MSDNEKPPFDPARESPAEQTESRASSDPLDAAEARMRRALGLEGEVPRIRPQPERADPSLRPVERHTDRFAHSGHRRRFIHDGEVPVTVVHGVLQGRREHAEIGPVRNSNGGQPVNRLEAAEAALAAEVAARSHAERVLQEAQATIRDLQTKLGHAELAQREASEALRRERETAAALDEYRREAELRLNAEREAREASERKLTAEREAREAAERKLTAQRELPAPPAPEVTEMPVAKRGRRPRADAPAKPAKSAKTRKADSPAKKSAPARAAKPTRRWVKAPRKKRQ